MWPFSKQSARRKEIRRTRAERGLKWYQHLSVRVRVAPSVVAALTALVAGLLVNVGGEVLTIRVGQRVPRAITARVEFQLENPARTVEMRSRARSNAENYYALDASLINDIQGRFINTLQLAKEQLGNPDGLKEAARRNRILLDDEGCAELLRIAGAGDSPEAQRDVERFRRAVEGVVARLVGSPPFLTEAIGPAHRRTAINAILIDPRPEAQRSGPEQRAVPVFRLLPANQPDAIETVAEAAVEGIARPLRSSMKASLIEMLRGESPEEAKPIYRYDAERSARAAQEAYAAVPEQYDVYGPDRQLADAGVITESEYRLLRKEHEAYQAWIGEMGQPLSPEEQARQRETNPETAEKLLEQRAAARQAHTAQRLSRYSYALLAMLVPLGLAYYLAQPRRRVAGEPRPHALMALALLSVLGAARLVFVATSEAYYTVGLQALAAALLTIVYSGGPVSAVGGCLALLITLATRQGPGFLLILLAVSMTLHFGLRDVRKRGKIVAVGAAASLVALVTAVAVGLIDQQTLAFAFWHRAMPAAGATLAAAFVAEGILPGIERLFKVSTSMSLLEWCDANRPLLRLLAAEAPGTYNHSLMIGTLAEAAADAIGARGLLARAGAYYHDIGKINKPGYFTENQAFGVSRHDRLSPAMSHLIIIGHVKDGIEMAREYGLPASLHPFIPEHHGTTLVEYFYHAASQKRKPGDPEISEIQFRYPGPKPQSRETAVLMLCDAVEGAVRAMPEPTPGRIEDTVSRIVQRRLIDGQFDECDLTFRELAIIERTLVKSLCAIYHSRIAYPGHEPQKPAESRAS